MGGCVPWLMLQTVRNIQCGDLKDLLSYVKSTGERDLYIQFLNQI